MYVWFLLCTCPVMSDSSDAFDTILFSDDFDSTYDF